MKVSFEIPGTLPGLNEIVGAINRHRMAGATLKKKWTRYCGEWVVARAVPKVMTPIKISFKWIEPHKRRDLDNICAGAKFCLDALVQTGRLPNDTREWVTGITHNFPPPDKENPRIIVTLSDE